MSSNCIVEIVGAGPSGSSAALADPACGAEAGTQDQEMKMHAFSADIKTVSSLRQQQASCGGVVVEGPHWPANKTA